MSLFGQTNYLKEDPTTLVGVLGITILLCLGLWRFIRWLFSGPPRPDPWSDEVAAEIAKDDAVPLCHRCLAPHDSSVNFCPDCGAPVGAYTNWLPYPYLFSIGHTLRIGASGDFRRSPLTIAELRREYEAGEKRALFEALQGFLPGGQGRVSRAELAARRGVSVGAIDVAIHRLRQRFGALLREQVAETVSSEVEVEEEIRHLISMLSA
jgi:hypothetical protein